MIYDEDDNGWWEKKFIVNDDAKLCSFEIDKWKKKYILDILLAFIFQLLTRCQIVFDLKNVFMDVLK